jgi:hypothetical protein
MMDIEQITNLIASWRAQGDDGHSLADILEKLAKEYQNLVADYEGLQYDAAKVVQYHEDKDSHYLKQAIETLRDNGRDGWWKESFK